MPQKLEYHFDYMNFLSGAITLLLVWVFLNWAHNFKTVLPGSAPGAAPAPFPLL